MVGHVTRRRYSSELLTRVLSVIACLSFVIGLTDVRLHQRPQAKSAELMQVPERERTGQVLATITGPGGATLATGAVQVFWEHAGRFYWVLAQPSNGLGQARLEHLPLGTLWLIAEAPGFARASSTLVLGAEPRAVKLGLAPAQSLAVTVNDEASSPLAKATVLVESSDPLPFGALTDERGLAQFGRLPPAPWSVKASAPGYESVSRSGVRAATAITLRRLASLTVTVQTREGKPAVGATVLIAGPTLWPARSAIADGRGVARITGLLAGSFDLRASLGFDVAPTVLGFELARGENGQLNLRLEPGRTVVALVTDGEGQNPLLVANADVVLAEAGLSSFPMRGRTGSDGKVALGPIAQGPATLGARAADFVGSGLVVVPELLSGPVRVPLTRGATIHGEVTDARGYPVEGATIEVVGSDANGLPVAETPALVGFRQNHFAWSLTGPLPLVPAGELGVMPGPVPPIPKPGADSAVARSAPDFEQPLTEPMPWVTNRGGKFSAAPVTPGQLRVIVRHPDYVEGTSELIRVASAGDASVKIVLLRGAALEGRVSDERGQPLARVEVELSSPRATRTEVVSTASDGSFAFAAVPADLTLSLSRPEDPARVVLRKSLHLAEGARERVELTLPAQREPVRVLVRDEDGRAVELAEVAATSLEPARPLRLTRFTDAEGVVTFEDALAENLRFSADAPGFARLSANFATAPKEVTLTLLRGVLVEGRVTAVRGRRGVPGATVSVQQQGGRKVFTTDEDGAFRVRDVAPGPARVRVEHPDFAAEELTVQVAATGRADRPFTLPDIDLLEPGEVEGDVLDERGQRVPGARVMIGDGPSVAPAGKQPRGVVSTDEDGHFVLGRVHPGQATISAVSTSAGRGTARGVEVSSGRTTRGVRIQLSAQTSDAEPLLASGNVALGLGERGSAPALEVVVVSVAEGSEAERAGLEAGDVIEALDGTRPTSMVDARARLSGAPGSDLVVEVRRSAQSVRFRVLREAIRR